MYKAIENIITNFWFIFDIIMGAHKDPIPYPKITELPNIPNIKSVI